jgi:hypothetical protein
VAFSRLRSKGDDIVLAEEKWQAYTVNTALVARARLWDDILEVVKTR